MMKPTARADRGQARILEAVVAAALIFVVFTAVSFFMSNPQATIVQERGDLDRLGYNVLGRIAESRTIEATIENSSMPWESFTSATPEIIQLKNFIHNSLPSSMLFNLTVARMTLNNDNWVDPQNLPATISNINDNSLFNSLAISSTPMIYTSKKGNIYSLALILANAGEINT